MWRLCNSLWPNSQKTWREPLIDAPKGIRFGMETVSRTFPVASVFNTLDFTSVSFSCSLPEDSDESE